jgi:hypothetical protein
VWLVDDHFMKLKMGLCSCPNGNLLIKLTWLLSQEKNYLLMMEYG